MSYKSPSGKFYRSRAHYDAARGARADYMSSGVSVAIDTRELEKLRKALIDAGVGYDRSQAILAQSLNRAGQRIRTRLERSIKQWTGIRRMADVRKRMTKVIATPGKMRAGVLVEGRHFRITKANFGAAWRRSSPGGTHAAWNRPQTAKGSFMAFKGGAKYGGGLLFKRTSSKRLPIKPLWGPHPVKEMRKREPFVRAVVTQQAMWFNREALRRAEVELQKAKAKWGL